jgi:hypothetical protein
MLNIVFHQQYFHIFLITQHAELNISRHISFMGESSMRRICNENFLQWDGEKCTMGRGGMYYGAGGNVLWADDIGTYICIFNCSRLDFFVIKIIC